MIEQVFDFNNSCLGVEPKEVPQLEYKHAMFCVKALREEAQELSDEHFVNQMIVTHDPTTEEARWQTVKSVDACIDAAYFAIGGMARAGLTPEQAMACFMAVHEANMTKKRGVAATRGDMGVADATKPEDFVPPDMKIYHILFNQEPPTDVEVK